MAVMCHVIESINSLISFDLEWSMQKDVDNEYPITAAGFFDNDKMNQALLIEDYTNKSEKFLLMDIVKILSQYDYSLGFYSTGVRTFSPIRHRVMGKDSDLIQLDRRLKRFGLISPIFINDQNHRPYLVGENRKHCHIDAYNLFANKIIKASIYNNAYNSYDLDTISRVILGSKIGGKYEGLSGSMFESLTDLEEKRNYVVKDARLLYECVAHNDWELLKVINAMATLIDVPFEKLCNFKGATQIWTPLLDSLVDKELDNLISQNDEKIEPRYNRLYNYLQDGRSHDENLEIEEDDDINNLDDKKLKGSRYIGGWVKNDVIRGQYRNVSVFDVTSLYPTMIVNNNISFETVNCTCCGNDPGSKVPEYLFTEKSKKYKSKVKRHICTKFQGVLTRQIADYMFKRIELKRLSKDRSLSNDQRREYEITSNSYKILINSAYGQMGHEFSKYENVYAAELITRFGRYTIQECAKIAREIMGWNVIYGDTDSLFIDSKITPEDSKIFIDTCKQRLNVDMELDKVYSKLLITGAKNYVGIIEGSKNLVVKGLAGKKSDRCLWVRNCFKQMLEDYRDDIDPCIKLRKEIRNLESGRLPNAENQLIIFKTLSKNPDEYKVNNIQKQMGTAQNKEASDTIRYYMLLGTKENGNTKWTEHIGNASIPEYRRQLINTVKPILKLLNIDVVKRLEDLKKTRNKSMSEAAIEITDKECQISLEEKSKIKNIKPQKDLSQYELIQLKWKEIL